MESELRADCARCFGLCCVAPAFSASSDFAINKPAGQPCPNLQQDFRCGIHNKLRQNGFPGCTVFDCFGAGQKIAQVTFEGRDWRTNPQTAPQMFAAFAVMRQLHELLYYLSEAWTMAPGPALAALRERLDGLTRLTPVELVALDVNAEWQAVNPLLLGVSARARASLKGVDRRGADLVGADLRKADLRGANLRGAYLLGADLRGADLRMADVIGADFRGAKLDDARLTGAIFLIQSQLDAASGNNQTQLPAEMRRPLHWLR